MAGLNLLYKFLLKEAAKGSGRASGILSIGGDVRKLANKKFQSYVMTAKKQGVDLDKLSEQEIKYMLEMNKPKGPTLFGHPVIDATSPEGQGITKDLFNMLDRQSGKNVIKTDFGGGITDIVTETITKIKTLKPIEGMKEANSVLARKGKYKNLTEEQSKKILKDTEDHIFERDIPIDPEDFAHGGRTGSGLNYLLGEDDQNSRVPFKDGTKFNPKRRTVLKGIAALATLPVIGKYFKWAKPLAKSSKVLTSVPINNIDGMPLWFKPLVNKVIKEGDDATAKLATGERQVIHRDVLPDGDEVTVTQHLDNGNVDVSVSGAKNDFNISKTGHGEQPYTISYVKGETIIGKNNKPIKVKDKMETDEGYSYSTGPDRTDVDMDFDLVNFTEKTTKHDTSVLNSYATGKKIKSTKKAQPLEDMSPEGDWDDSLDFASGGRVSLSNGGIAGMLGE